jgi:hypothetical protein
MHTETASTAKKELGGLSIEVKSGIQVNGESSELPLRTNDELPKIKINQNLNVAEHIDEIKELQEGEMEALQDCENCSS